MVQPAGFKFQREGWDPGVKKTSQQMLFSAFRNQEDWGSWRDRIDVAAVDEETTTTLESNESLNK